MQALSQWDTVDPSPALVALVLTEPAVSQEDSVGRAPVGDDWVLWERLRGAARLWELGAS